MITKEERITERIYTAHGFSKDSLSPLRVLHIGCGADKITDATGLDMLSLPGVDVVHNLDVIPWPFEANTFDVVVAHAVLEHVTSFIAVMEEVHRVCKNGARIVVCVPYFRSIDAYTDPTHTHFFTSYTLDYISSTAGLANYHYSKASFRQVGFWYGWPQRSKRFFARAFKNFIHKHRRFYDQYLSLIIPVRILLWEIEVIKK